MNYLYPLIAIHIDGKPILLYSNDALASFIGKYGQFTEHHVDYYYDISSFMYRRKTNGWIVRDDRGKIVKYDDVVSFGTNWKYYNKRQAEIRGIAAKGLPIPRTGTSKAGWKMNHVAKKNSGSGHRNRNRALAIYDAKEYDVKNNVGNRVIPYEHW